MVIPAFRSDLPELRQELAEYYRLIYRMDQGVGTVLAALEREGLANDTLVLILSDNGPPFMKSKTTFVRGWCSTFISASGPTSDKSRRRETQFGGMC